MIKNFNTQINLKLKLLLFITIILCFLNTYNTSLAKISNNINDFKKHKTNKNIIRIYNSDTRKLTYNIYAESINHFHNKHTIYLKKIKSIMFNTNHLPIWIITAQHAYLTKEKILSLSGNVQIQNLTNKNSINKITTNQSTINLITHDIYSNNKIILYGKNFNSIGMKMHSNLISQTIKFFNHIETKYEI